MAVGTTGLPDHEGLEAEIAGQMQAARVPGLALAAVRGDEIVYAKGFGVTSVEGDGQPVTAETLFRIGSIAKPLTGTLVVRLADAGVVDLDRPIKAYVPWFTLSDPAAAERITLRMLLTHTSGIPHRLQPVAGREGMDESRPAAASVDEATAAALDHLVRHRLPRAMLIAPPGKVLSYSTVGISLAGYVAQVVCGRPYPAVIRDWLLTPLEMRHTGWDREGAAASGQSMALGHELSRDGTLRPRRHAASEATYRPAGTDAMSSVVDLAHFALAHVNGGRFRGREILAPPSVAEMHARHVETHDANDQGHGLTFVLDTYKGARRVGHGGLSGTFAGFVRLAPDHGIGVAILYSRWQGFLPAERSIVNGIFDRLLDLPTGPPAPPLVVEVDRTSWERHAGAYAGWWTGPVKITSNDAGLTLEARGREGHVVPLEPAREHVYVGHPPGRTEPISVGFVPEPDGPTRWIKVDGLVCERLEAGAPAAADPAEWAPYAGTYAGPLDTLTVHAQPGCLTIHSKADAEGVECLPVDTHRFSCKWGLVAFQVAADGSVPSLKAGQRPLQEPFTYTRIPVGA